MSERCDVLVGGTGLFAEKIVFALAMTATKPLTIAVGGRNAERMRWLAMAGNARAALFQRPVRTVAAPIRWESAESVAETMAAVAPRVYVQTATVQTPRDFDRPTTVWQRLVVRAGGFGVTAPLQALLLARAERALRLAGLEAFVLNACYPDLVNAMMAARGTPVACGLGNISSVAAFITADLGYRAPGTVRMLVHHQSPSLWRRPPEERTGIPPRVWLDGRELDDVFRRFAHIRMPKDPRQSIAGESAVPIILAFAGHADYQGHAAGPLGLVGGYPIAIRGGRLSLDLPPGLVRDHAIAYNQRFAEHEPLRIDGAGRVLFADRARAELATQGATLASGFHVRALEDAAAEMLAIRNRLEVSPGP